MENLELGSEELNKAKSGDIGSFEKILFRYEKRILNYIFSIVGQKQDAEDITQETFVKVYKNLKRLKPDLSFRSWLYTIATNTARDWFRKKGRRMELLIINDSKDVLETIEDKAAYNKIETAKDLQDALKVLRPEYRTVLTLFYWQGFGYEEIAKILNLPLNTIKTYLYRAKKSLKSVLISGSIKS